MDQEREREKKTKEGDNVDEKMDKGRYVESRLEKHLFLFIKIMKLFYNLFEI